MQLPLGLQKGGTTMEEKKRSVEFITISADKVNFGKNNFIEVARKKAVSEDGENEFISLTRGYYLPDGTERFKKSITVPDEEEVKSFIVDKIKSI